MDPLSDERIYQPLTGDNIRLLTLQPGSFHDPIHCTLKQISLSDDHAYEALSYCWGDPNDLLEITLDETTHLITRNLHHALQYLRHPESSRTLWIDALCINQKSNSEKSNQVTKMGAIYSKATKVYAWLGESSRENDLVFDVLREFGDRRKEVEFLGDTHERVTSLRKLFRVIYEELAGAIPEKSFDDDEMLPEEVNWLHLLYERDYWCRAWIVQELILAKEVVVCCEHKNINFDDIYGIDLLRGWSTLGFDSAAHQEPTHRSRGWNTIQAIHQHRRWRELEEELWKGVVYLDTAQMLEPHDITMMYDVVAVYAQHHQCSCSLDKVYAFRELVPQWKKNLVVDYKRSRLDVFTDVAKLDLMEPRESGGWGVAFCLWKAMDLGDREKFNDFLPQCFPEQYQKRPSTISPDT